MLNDAPLNRPIIEDGDSDMEEEVEEFFAELEDDGDTEIFAPDDRSRCLRDFSRSPTPDESQTGKERLLDEVLQEYPDAIGFINTIRVGIKELGQVEGQEAAKAAAKVILENELKDGDTSSFDEIINRHPQVRPSILQIRESPNWTECWPLS